MSRIAYVNGRYVPHAHAEVHVEDRGYQLADGVYEVCAVWDGLLIDETRHLDRLERSLRELRIAMPMPRAAIAFAMRELVARNRIHHGIVYLQVTRGVARRDHPFPANAKPALVMTARAIAQQRVEASIAKGIAVVSAPDIRWGRCDIKTVALLPNVLAKQLAREAGAYEAWLTDPQGFVTEGSSTNAWIVDQSGKIVTRALTANILPGVTRRTIMGLSGELNAVIEERPFTIAEAQKAREAFITAASAAVIPVISVDGVTIGDGKPGPVALAIRAAYRAHALVEARHLHWTRA
ncbi:MAG TPA: D-amino-acid transaminase [Micropepsaceae bacterium]|nr:D-amino-acid transaminase [Micropepsaceae bacterium]